MRITLASNLWLYLSAILLISGALALRAAAGRSSRWRWACVICPILAALAASLALAEPLFKWNPSANRIVVLLDLSASTRTSPWHDPQWLRALALRHLAASTHLTVVGFAGQTQLLLSDASLSDTLKWPLEWPAPGPGGASTNLAAALAWRDVSETQTNSLAPRWLITDGLLDASALPPPPYALAVTALPPTAIDAGIADIFTRSAAAEAPAELWVRLRATGPAQVDVDLYRDEERLARQPVDFTGAGDRWISVRTRELPMDRPTRLTARLTYRPPQHADPWPENDQASLLYLPEGPPRVLVVGQDAPGLAAALAAAGLRPHAIRAADMPVDSASLVEQGWQVVVLDNVPLKAPAGAAGVEPLSPEAARSLDAFVQQTGGGLVLLGGRYAFGPGYYPDGTGTLEKLSPLAAQPPQRPGAHVIFLLDASASMNEPASDAAPDAKFSLVARGVESALELLQPRDTITIITFNGHSTVQASGPKAEVEKILEEKLHSIRPQGTTAPDTALPLLEPLLPPDEKPVTQRTATMVVLLTDGEIPRLDLPAWKTLLSRSGAMLTVVAPTPTAGAEDALPLLAKENHATWLALDGAADWTTLLRRAVAERLMGKARTTTLSWTAESPALSGTTARWIETYLKPEATLRAAGEPRNWALAATARRGLGQTAAMAMDADTEAARALAANLIEEIAPPAGDRRFVLSAQRAGGGWLLRADGHDEKGFLDGLHLRARIISTEGDDRLVDMPQTGPGVYEGIFLPQPSAGGGPFAAIVTRATGSGAETSLVGTMRPPDVQTQEFPASVERAALPETAVTLPTDDDALWSPRLTGWSANLSPELWTLAALLALISLWLRRGH